MKIYVDLDGTLADFDSHYESYFGPKNEEYIDIEWRHFKNIDNFFYHLEPLEDLKLWKYLEKYDPIILTGVPPEYPEASDQKRAWVEKYIGKQTHIICCESKDKSVYCNPGDILIDDWEKYKHLWLEKGGIWITHTSADESIKKFKNILSKR